MTWTPSDPATGFSAHLHGSRYFQSIACMLDSKKRFEVADELQSVLYTPSGAGSAAAQQLHGCADVYPDILDFHLGPHQLRPCVWKRRMLERHELLLLDAALRFHGDRVMAVWQIDVTRTRRRAPIRTIGDRHRSTLC